MKQKERQERSRQEILLAAMAEFGIHNYEDVTMEGICTAHGISKGMMYHYYANKDAVFLVCVEEVFRRLRAYIETQAAVLAPLEPLERIRNYFVIRESYFQQHPIERNIFENAQFRPPRHLVDEIQARRQPLPGHESAFPAADYQAAAAAALCRSCGSPPLSGKH